MRTWGLALLAVIAGCVSPRPAPPPRPLPRLATPGDLFLISTEDGAAQCKRWEVVPAAAGQGQLVRSIDISGEPGIDTIDYRLDGAALTLTGRTRGTARRLSSMGCEVHLPSEDLIDAVAVGDSRWFAHAAGCTQALAQGARVATDLSKCEFEPLVPDAVQQATRHRFEELLRGGGIAYAVLRNSGAPSADEQVRCAPFNVTPSKHQRAGLVTGSMWREIVSDGRRGKAGTRYMYLRGGSRVGRNGPDELTLLGSGVTYEDGSGYGIGCLRREWVRYGRGVVDATGTLYLTRATCQAEIARQQLHDAWVPEVPQIDDLDEDQGPVDITPDTEEATEAAAGDEDDTSTSFGLSGC